MTGLYRWHIARAIKRLEARNIITISGNKHKLTYSFQKDYDKWKTLSDETINETLPIMVTTEPPTLPKLVTESLPIMVTNGEQPQKPIITKIGNTSLPKLVTESLPKLVNTKTKNTLLKQELLLATTKEIELFTILEQLKVFPKDRPVSKLRDLQADYPNLNYKLEFKKFVEFWEAKKLKLPPWLALMNWLEKAHKDPKPTKSGWDKNIEDELEV